MYFLSSATVFYLLVCRANLQNETLEGVQGILLIHFSRQMLEFLCYFNASESKIRNTVS
jgi:hypothetical protein